VGHPFRDKYAIFSSSGTTGIQGLFVQDPDALAVYDALGTARMGALAPLWDWRTSVGGHRFALVAATGGHFAGVVMWERLRALHPWFAKNGIVIPVTDPLEKIERALEAFRPTVLASYSTVLRALAERKQAGELLCSPHTLWYGGEWMAPECRRDIARAFGGKVAGDYGASEFLNIAFECEKGELHVNSDWAILEPVDEHGDPVAPGEPSANVLLTNLANRVQPFIRYELGDSVTIVPGACGCGRHFPRIRVEGRRDEILRLRDAQGHSVPLMPLALCTAIEEGSGLHRFQVEQVGPRRLVVRVEGGGERAHAKLKKSLADWLAAQGLPGIAIAVQAGRLVAHPVSGKFRQVFRKS
jgi:phenylacetate-coenzyme A ligase PaaK-like adenylate-forming protein